jgi:FkbM family methyltransferase
MSSIVESTRSLIARTSRRLGLRISRLAPTQIRGHEPLVDLQYLLGRDSSLTVFDVGANDGDTSSAILGAFPAAQVIAVEPFDKCCQDLALRFAGNPRVRVENIALGDQPGQAELNLYSGSKMNSLLELDRDPAKLMSGFKKMGSAAVRVDTIDNYCSANQIDRIDLLKVDTQGFDLNVLRGATSMFRDGSIGAVLLEVNFVPMYSRQSSFVELHAYLANAGFRLVDLYNQVWMHGHIAWCDACYVGPKVITRHTLVQ